MRTCDTVRRKLRTATTSELQFFFSDSVTLSPLALRLTVSSELNARLEQNSSQINTNATECYLTSI